MVLWRDRGPLLMCTHCEWCSLLHGADCSVHILLLTAYHSPASVLRHCSSVPSGRVGNSKDAIFRSNEHFRGAVAEREAAVSSWTPA